MLNKIILIGRITRDIELRYTTTNKAVANFGIAVNRTFKNQNGEYDADFINIELWGNQAETTQKYCKKGDLVAIEGSLRVDQYQDQQGNNKYKNYVLANHISFLSTKKETQEQKEEVQEQYDPHAEFKKQVEVNEDDLPF